MPIWNRRKKKDEPLPEQEALALPTEIDPALQMEFETFAEDDSSEPTPRETKDTTRTASGLYPHEIVILDLAATLYTDQEEFPIFWRRDYGILQMPKLLADLVDRGFLTDAPIDVTLEAATVPALKQALKTCGKPVGGKKAELVDRLLTTVSEGELYALFPRRAFTLTPAGIKAVTEAMHIPYLHKRPVEGMTIWSLHRAVAEHPEQSYRELIRAHLEDRSRMHIEAKDYAAYRACRYRMYQFQMEESKRKRAFPFLAEVIYYDLSGVSGGTDTLHRYVSEKYFFPYDQSIVRIPANCVKAMGKLQADLGLSEEMLRALLIQFLGQLSIPFHLFTVEECAVIVLLELRGDTEKLRKVYELAETRFSQRK
ncbi:MAG: SAP domain-containing protein [Oscillospiraceae bacterium]|nr:SAP domain-containing protein [Oscillospiraceae bacterium]